MKRGTKNICMIIIILLLIGVNYCLIDIAVNNTTIDVVDKCENTNTEMLDYNIEVTPKITVALINATIEKKSFYYILFGINSSIIALLVVYLLMSKFNKKTYLDTFSDNDKLIIFVLSTVILAEGITFIDHLVYENRTIDRKDDNGLCEIKEEVTYDSATTFTLGSAITTRTFASSKSRETALLIKGNIRVAIGNSVITKTGSFDGDIASNYGINSALLAKEEAYVKLTDSKVSTNAHGANALYSYGTNTIIDIEKTEIKTEANNASGLVSMSEGTLRSTNSNVTTKGSSSPAIKAMGTIKIQGGTFKTFGSSSPVVDVRGEVSVNNATLATSTSEGVVVNGNGIVTLENTTLKNNNSILNLKSPLAKNIFIYSESSSKGTSSFTAIKSNITTYKGDTIYVTNTNTSITLINSKIVNNDSEGYFLNVSKDAWGTTGSNGADVNLSLTTQTVEGNIKVDKLSKLAINLVGSHLKTTINKDNVAGEISVKLDKRSTLRLTGDSYITSLENEDKTNSNIILNGYKLYVKGELLK